MSIRDVAPVNGQSGWGASSAPLLDVSLGSPPPIERVPPPQIVETEDYTIRFLDPERSLTEFVKEDHNSVQQQATASMDEERWRRFLGGIKRADEDDEDFVIPSLWEDLLPESFFHVAQTVSSASQSALGLIGSAQRNVGKIRGIVENIEEHTHIGEKTGALVSSMLASSIDLGKKGFEAAKNYVNPPDS